MGSSKQLAQGDDEEDVYEPKHITSKQLDDKLVISLLCAITAPAKRSLYFIVNTTVGISYLYIYIY